MTTTLRVLALVCVLGFLVIGWVWAYWIGLAGFALGGIGWALLAWATRLEREAGTAPEGGARRLHLSARWVILGAGWG